VADANEQPSAADRAAAGVTAPAHRVLLRAISDVAAGTERRSGSAAVPARARPSCSTRRQKTARRQALAVGLSDARVARSGGIDPSAVVPDLGLSRSAATCDSNQLTRLDGEGHLVQDLTFPGVLADTGHVDPSPDGSPRLHPHRHDILPEFWPDSFGQHGRPRRAPETNFRPPGPASTWAIPHECRFHAAGTT
jgi:hypothetical protein